MIESLRGKHDGKTCYIIGNGPSIKYLRAKHFGPGPVIALNQSIEIVERLWLKSPVYSLQKDGCGNKEPHEICNGQYAHHMIRPMGAVLLNHEPESGECLTDYAPRYTWSNERDFKQLWNANSAISALCFAHHFGCKSVVFVCFDSITNGDCGRFYDDGKDEYTYQAQAKRQAEFLKMTDLAWMYIQPIKEYDQISVLQARYEGETCHIVGRGPSLVHLKASDFGPGPIITINEAIIEVSRLNLPNDIYALWRNGGEGDYFDDVRIAIEWGGAKVLLCDDPVTGGEYEWPPSSAMFYGLDAPPPFDSKQYVFDCWRDFNLDPGSCFSHLSAYMIANRVFGCSKVVSMCFDSYRGIMDVKDPDGVHHEKWNCYETQARIMDDITRADESHSWFFPEDGRKTITVITCTGDRPETFGLCQRWMEQQTRKPDQWIVVDDGKIPLHVIQEPFMKYLRREPQPDDPPHTLNTNIAYALKHVAGDIILFFEDDDYYAPRYIETMDRIMTNYPECQIAGYANAKYYHVPTGKYFIHKNRLHASLAQTAIRRDSLSVLKKCCETKTVMPLDMLLWSQVSEDKRIMAHDTDHLFCGIKGMPGRGGISSGHTGYEQYYSIIDTPDRRVLKEWVPDNFRYYLEIVNRGESQFRLSIIMATRGRPENVRRIYDDILRTASDPEDIEIVLAVDQDDQESHNLDHPDLQIQTVVFPPGVGVGNYWRGCLAEARGRYVLFMPDDVHIQTSGWDTMIYDSFSRFPDDIALVHVNDLIFGEKLCCMPCVSRKAAITASLVDTRYNRYRIDDHIHHVFDILTEMGHDRHVYRPDIVFEHDHYAVVNGKRVYMPALMGVDASEDAFAYISALDDRRNSALVLAYLIDSTRMRDYMTWGPKEKDRAHCHVG